MGVKSKVTGRMARYAAVRPYLAGLAGEVGDARAGRARKRGSRISREIAGRTESRTLGQCVEAGRGATAGAAVEGGSWKEGDIKVEKETE